MIAPLGKHLRKWLLGVAVAAGHQIQAVVAALASAEGDPTGEAGPETATGGAKRARTGGPPDHWVQLVARHAPELLQTGTSEVLDWSPSPISGSETGLEGQPREDNQGQKFGSPPPVQGEQSPSFELLRAPEEYDNAGNERKTPALGHPDQAGDHRTINGIDAASSGHIRDGAATHDPEATRTGSVRLGQPAVSLSGANKAVHRRAPGRDRHNSFFEVREPTAVFRDAERPDKDAVGDRSSQSSHDPIENQRAGLRESKISKATEPTARRVEPGFSKKPRRSADSAGVARMLTPVEIKRAVDDGIRPGPDGMSQAVTSAQDTAGMMSTQQRPAGKDSAGPANAARIINGRRSVDQRPQMEKETGGTLPPTDLSWPSLPGEKETEDAGDARLTAAWPDLPAQRLAEAKPLSNQMDSYPAATGSRDIERLRRLDEEQKGRSWNASHF
jgi:hypothetical protein